MTRKLNWKNILLINRIFFDDSFISVIEVLFFGQYLGLSFADFSVIMGICLILSLVAQYPTGFLSDNFGRKKMLIVGRTLEAFSILAMLLLPYCLKGNLFVPVLLIEGVRTVMTALASGNFEVLIFDMFKKENLPEEQFAEKSVSYFSGGAILSAIFGFISTLLFSYLMLLPLLLDFLVKILKLSFIIFIPSEISIRKKEKTRAFIPLRYEKQILFIIVFFAILFSISRGSFSLYQPLMTNLGIPIYYYGFLIMIVNLAVFGLLRLIKERIRIFTLSKLFWISFLTLTSQLIILSVTLLEVTLARFIMIAILLSSMQIIRLFSEGMSSYFINQAIHGRGDKTTAFSLYSMVAQLFLSVTFFMMGIMEKWSNYYLLTYLYLCLLFSGLLLVFYLYGRRKNYA